MFVNKILLSPIRENMKCPNGLPSRGLGFRVQGSDIATQHRDVVYQLGWAWEPSDLEPQILP